MSLNTTKKAVHSATGPAVNLNDRAVRSLADAIYKHLQDEGCQARDIISVSSQLLGLLTEQIREDRPAQ
ncbi:MAG: hypothetical protein WCO71_05710 [Pseudomonadota bacterium]